MDEERKVFYIDVGNLTKHQKEEIVKKIKNEMNDRKLSLTINSETIQHSVDLIGDCNET